MPQKPKVGGNPDEPVLLQVQVPTWMKRRAMELAEAQGKSLSDWFRDLLRGQTGTRDDKRARSPVLTGEEDSRFSRMADEVMDGLERKRLSHAQKLGDEDHAALAKPLSRKKRGKGSR